MRSTIDVVRVHVEQMGDSAYMKHGASGKVANMWRGMKTKSGWPNTSAKNIGMGYKCHQWVNGLQELSKDCENSALQDGEGNLFF